LFTIFDLWCGTFTANECPFTGGYQLKKSKNFIMKIAFQIPLADIDTAWVQMENQYLKLRAIADLLSTDPVYAIDADDATKVNIYVNIEKTVQSAGSGTNTPAVKFYPMSNQGQDVWNDFQPSATIAKFNAGVTYLIPVGAFAPTTTIPAIKEFPLGNTPTKLVIPDGGGTVYSSSVSATHYRWDCAEDVDVLNDNAVDNVITVRLNGTLSKQISDNKKVKKASEIISFAGATGLDTAMMVREYQATGSLTL